MFPKLREKINHFDSYEKELKVLNQAYLVLGYSWTSHNSHRRMDYQKSDWEGRGGEGGMEGGGEDGAMRAPRDSWMFSGFFVSLDGFFLCTT